MCVCVCVCVCVSVCVCVVEGENFEMSVLNRNPLSLPNFPPVKFTTICPRLPLPSHTWQPYVSLAQHLSLFLPADPLSTLRGVTVLY